MCTLYFSLFQMSPYFLDMCYFYFLKQMHLIISQFFKSYLQKCNTLSLFKVQIQIFTIKKNSTFTPFFFPEKTFTPFLQLLITKISYSKQIIKKLFLLSSPFFFFFFGSFTFFTNH